MFAVTRQRGGEIQVDSQPGRGTVVTVKLPVVARDLTTRAPQGGTPRGTETVLAVEDDPLVRETIEGDLRALGYTPLMAGHPAEALAIARRAGPIDLLLTDVMMPETTGRRAGARAHAPAPGPAGAVHVCAPAIRAAAAPSDRTRRPPAEQAVRAARAGRGGARGPGHARERAQRRRRARSEAARGRRALIVDDDPDVAETMGDALEQAGLPATIAHSGAEAIRIAGDVRPVLVFCDVALGKGHVGL